MTTSIKSVDITWPHSLGFFGAVGVAAALELITIPIAILVSSVPFVKRAPRAGGVGWAGAGGRRPIG
ncbi:MAG: hypothetical protein M3082_06770 [Candidatus Dormibacteraeota bacterium]|nr:hypothetical protein [Candidatus Dormibacteraeota bacterium]